MMVVTTETIPGKKCTVLGLVRGHGGGVGASYNNAINNMIDDADDMGADAIVAFRFAEYGNGFPLAYGTAVCFEDEE